MMIKKELMIKYWQAKFIERCVWNIKNKIMSCEKSLICKKRLFPNDKISCIKK